MPEWSWAERLIDNPTADGENLKTLPSVLVLRTLTLGKRTLMPNSPLRIEKKAAPRPLNTASESWVLSASQKKVRAMAGGVGLAVFGGAMLLDKLVPRQKRPRQMTMAWNATAGFLAGWFAMKSIDRERERRKNIDERLKMIGDLNHHVRNALQSIQLSAYSTHDQEIIASVGDSVQRIEWALREIVPEH